MNSKLFTVIAIIGLMAPVLIGSNVFVSSLIEKQSSSTHSQSMGLGSQFGVAYVDGSVSPTTDNNSATESVHMLVIRITNNTGAMGVDNSAVRIVSPEIIAKYQILQSVLQAADKQAEDYNKQCQNSQCENSLAQRITPGYNTQIPAAIAKVIMDDSDLHFATDSSLPPSVKLSYINTGGITYIIYL